MKSQKIVASLIASFGVYLVLTTLITAVTGFVGALGAAREMRDDWPTVAAQYAAFAAPLVVGCVLVFGAYQIAAVVSRAARISDDEVLLPEPMVLLRVILACIGVFILINSASFVFQLAFDVFAAKAASNGIGEHAQRLIPGTQQLVALLIRIVAAGMLIRNAKVISQWFEHRWEKGT